MILGVILVSCGFFQFATGMPDMENTACSIVMPAAYMGDQNSRGVSLALFVMLVFMFSPRVSPRQKMTVWHMARRNQFYTALADPLLLMFRRGILHSRAF